VEVIPVLKGLGVMYCIGWGYGRVLASGDAESSIGRAFSPRVVGWLLPGPLALFCGVGVVTLGTVWGWSFDEFRDLGLVKL
jgi:hypothetical protein